MIKKVNNIFIINFIIQNDLFYLFYDLFYLWSKDTFIDSKRWYIVIVDVKTSNVELSFKV